MGATTMRAMVLETPGPIDDRPLRPREVAVPVPGPGEVAIDVRACAVCRTDLQLCTGDVPARRLPVIPGHQAVGHVGQLGEGVSAVAIGDRVGLAWLAGACGSCADCGRGRENLCGAATFSGWDRDGGFAERIVARADFVHRLPPGLADEEAAPLLCGGIIGLRSLNRSGVGAGGRLGLYGFGASALLTLQVAVHRGCEVFVITRSPAARARAAQLGAAWTGDGAPPVPLDGAITFAPTGATVVSALSALVPGGTVAVNAIHLDSVPAFDYDLLWGERTITSVANFTRDDARDFLHLAARIPLRTRIECHGLADANLALQRLAGGQVDGAAVLTVSR